MKLTAIYPQIELGGDPRALREIGVGVEALGYDSLLLLDHVAGAVQAERQPPLLGPYTDKDPFHDPFVAFGYLAGLTTRLELATGILVLPQRQTLLVARQAADVELVSDGRLRLGVGSGWNYVEFEALGQDFHNRGARLDEQIALLRQLWTTTSVDFAGRFHRIDRAGLNPRPRRPIPIFCGGGSEPAYRRGAKLGDGFIFSGDLFGSILPGWSRVQALLAENGRPTSGYGAEYLLSSALSVPTAVETMQRWRDVGGTQVGVRSMGHGFETAAAHLDYFNAVAAGWRALS